MPRVPTYDNAQIASRPINAPTVGGRGPDNSGMIDGFNRLGSAVSQFAQNERRKADEAALLDADTQLQKWQLDTMFNPQSGVYTKKGSNALDVTNQTLDQFEAAQAKIGEGLKTESQRARYNEMVSRRRLSLDADLNRYEFGERQNYYDQVDAGQVETAMQGAALYYNEPSKIAQYQTQMAAVLESQAQRKGLPPEAAQAQLLKANSSMSTAVISRMVADNPYTAKEYFKQAEGAMTAEDQVQVSRMIDREIKSREVEARQMQAIGRAELASRVQDASAAYLQGLDFVQPPSKAEFVASYGAEEGVQRYDQFLKVQSVGSAMRELAVAGPEEREQILSSYNPATAGQAGEGFAQDAKLYGMLTNAAVGLQRELQDDPATYAARYSEDVRRAAEALANGEDGAEEVYAAAMMAEQNRLGVSNPQLLSKKQAASIVEQFSQTEDGGSNAAQVIEGLQQQWGKNWPTVFKQLQGKLPGAALVIGSGVDQATGATLARIAPLKTEELKKGLDSTAASEVRSSLNDQMAEFRATLAEQSGGERTFATLYNEAERLSYAYMGQGKSPQDAVSEAYRAMVDDKYIVRGSWRAPKQFDADLIERGADLIKESISPDELAFQVPAGVSPEFANERIKAAISSEGYWVTLPDESGLALYYGGAAVVDKEGRPIARSWDDLTGTAATTPSTWDKFQKGNEQLRTAPAPAGAWDRTR